MDRVLGSPRILVDPTRHAVFDVQYHGVAGDDPAPAKTKQGLKILRHGAATLSPAAAFGCSKIFLVTQSIAMSLNMESFGGLPSDTNPVDAACWLTTLAKAASSLPPLVRLTPYW